MSRPIVLPVPTNAAPARFLSPRRAWAILLLVWFAIHFAALFSPPLLDDADAAHANAAQHMALSGDWVTLKIDGIRYLGKGAASLLARRHRRPHLRLQRLLRPFPDGAGCARDCDPRLVLDATRL